jgi:hypothetical protein
MKKIELEVVTKSYPQIWTVVIDNSKDKIFIVGSPFGNCQSYSIISAFKLLELNKEELLKLFKLLVFEVGKTQFVIDIKYEISEELLQNLDFLIKDKYTMEYESTNHSNMILYLIQLKREKLR